MDNFLLSRLGALSSPYLMNVCFLLDFHAYLTGLMSKEAILQDY